MNAESSYEGLTKKNGEKRKIKPPSGPVKKHQQSLLELIRTYTESKYEDFNYGWRSGRGLKDAVRKLEKYRDQGFEWVGYVDVKNCFNSISPRDALNIIDTRIQHIPEITGKDSLPQGHPLSQELANFYLHQFDETASSWLDEGCKLIRYGDDIWLLHKTRKWIEEYISKAKNILKDLDLDTRSKVRHVRDGVECLGYMIYNDYKEPHPENVKNYKVKVLDKLTQFHDSNDNEQREHDKQELLDIIRGWRRYYGTQVFPFTLDTIDNIIDEHKVNSLYKK